MEDLPSEDLRVCFRSLESINRLTGAYRPTLAWLDSMCETLRRQGRPIHIVDVGSGYGGMLRSIARWAAEKHIPVVLTGIDLNPNALSAARDATPPEVATFTEGNVFELRPAEGIDLVMSSQFTHHFEDQAVVDFLRWMESSARLGWFISDLHRQPLTFFGFRALTSLTTLHPIAIQDGLVSILRSFRRQDWQSLCQEAAVPPNSVTITEQWPARLCVARSRPASA